jgi:hypothetical protein
LHPDSAMTTSQRIHTRVATRPARSR